MLERLREPDHATTATDEPTPEAGGVHDKFDLAGFVDFAKPVQAKGELRGDDAHAVASRGLADASSALPHAAAIQRSFGHHDVGGIRAAVGGAAADASSALGAHAYASGDGVAFAQSPDLHLAAHEAAHVVQQRGGVQLSGGIGETGDVYERHADAVADIVVQGGDAQPLLDTMANGGAPATQSKALQAATAEATVPLVKSADVGTDLVFPEMKVPTPLGTLKLSGIATPVKLAPPPIEGAEGIGVELRGTKGADTGANGVSAKLTNVFPTVAEQLGLDFQGITDTFKINSAGKGTYTLGFSAPLPSFGPLSSTFKFNLVDVIAAPGKEPEIEFGTFEVGSKIALPVIYGVSAQLDLKLVFVPNYAAILAELGVTAGELAGGLAGAALVTYLVAKAYESAQAAGRAEGLATWYVTAYAHTLADAIYGKPSRLAPVPTSTNAITGVTDPAACTESQNTGKSAGAAAAHALSPAQIEEIQAKYSQLDFIAMTEIAVAAKLGYPGFTPQ
ncbi:MAG: DUF4157 domain-containing protein [Kofleriaceae bacterium]